MDTGKKIAALVAACHDTGISLDVVLSAVPEWSLVNRPTIDFHFKNPFDRLNEELHSLHDELWENGVKVSLVVTRTAIDYSEGATGQLKLKTPGGVIHNYSPLILTRLKL